MDFERMDHITINVVDLKQTLWFYGDLLGLKRLPDIDFEEETLYFFELPGFMKLELIMFKHDTRICNLSALEKGIFRHLAFSCKDVYAVEKELTESGYPFHVPVSYNEKLGFYGGLTKDPNGVELEFLQYKLPKFTQKS